MTETTNTTGIVAGIEQAGAAALGAVESAGAAVLQAVEHPITTIEHAAGAAVAGLEEAAAAVKVELEDLVAKVHTYFHTTNAGHLEDALVAIANRVQAMEATVADLRAFIGK